MAKTLARKKKTLRRSVSRTAPRGSGRVAKKKTPLKRKMTTVMSKKKMVKRVAKKVTKKLMKRVMAKKKSPMPAGTVGKVVHYYDKIGVAILELTAPLTLGELLTFKRGQREFTQPVSSMQINHALVEKAKKGDVVGVKVVQVADSGTLAFRA